MPKHLKQVNDKQIRLHKKWVKPLIVFSGIFLIGFGCYSQRVNIQKRMAETTIPFNWVVSSKAVLNSHHFTELNESQIHNGSYSQLKQQSLYFVKQFNQDIKKNKRIAPQGLDNQTSKKINSYLSTHRYLKEADLIKVGTNHQGNYFEANLVQLNDTHQIKSILIKCTYQNKKLLSSKYLKTINSKASVTPIFNSSSTKNDGLNDITNESNRLSNLLISSELYDKINDQKYSNVLNSLNGLRKEHTDLDKRSDPALYQFLKYSNGDFKRLGLTQIEYTDIPNNSYFLLKEANNSGIKGFWLTYNRNTQKFISLREEN